MMPKVLTTLATITCPHTGMGTSVPSTMDWLVDGGAVLVEGDTGTLSCPFVVPCVGYNLRSMGLNATTIEGRKVILVTDLNQSFTGLPLTMVESHHVVDDSTPAPIPAGQEAPPLSPAMADDTQPVVVAVTPAAAFDSITQLPPAIPITFTLATAFPLQWTLTWISEPDGKSQDLTNGMPGALPLPVGGSWTTPALTVVLTLTTPFLSTLASGRHHFYMAGASQRGLSGIDECVLVVS
jgi:hypothetical protein